MSPYSPTLGEDGFLPLHQRCRTFSCCSGTFLNVIAICDTPGITWACVPAYWGNRKRNQMDILILLGSFLPLLLLVLQPLQVLLCPSVVVLVIYRWSGRDGSRSQLIRSIRVYLRRRPI